MEKKDKTLIVLGTVEKDEKFISDFKAVYEVMKDELKGLSTTRKILITLKAMRIAYKSKEVILDKTNDWLDKMLKIK